MPEGVKLFPHSSLGEKQLPLDVAAVTYFLTPLIVDQLPALVSKLYPGSERNMTPVDRASAVAVIDAELERLRAEKDDLGRDIDAAGRAAFPKDSYRPGEGAHEA